MNDRFYLRANFSTSTTPPSGGRMKDPYGHEYASIPLQFPSNLIDNTKRPKSIEMLLTKLNIPLGSIPISQIGLNKIERFRSGGVSIETKGIMTIWPFMIRSDGLLDGGYEYFPTDIDLHDWPSSPMVYPLQSFLTPRSNVNLRLQAVEYSKKLSFFNIEDLMDFLTLNLNDTYNAIMATGGTVDMRFQFTEENSRLKLHAINEGAKKFVTPYSNQVLDAWGSAPFRSEGQIMTYRTDSRGVITEVGDTSIVGFSIVVNKAIRDMFPRLPWREVNNDELEEIDYTHRTGQQIPDWKDHNWGDPYFYVLDTMTCDSKFVDNGLLLPDRASLGDMLHVRGIDFTFDACNLISIVPIQCFVVIMSGVGMTQQTFPINVKTNTMSSALTSSVPIVEVYYPLWKEISDLSTNVIISKDIFSNAAPFVLDENALSQRNITFTVHYIMNDGTMHELTIPSNTTLSLQACYCVKY